MAEEWRRGEYVISTDKNRFDLGVVHGFLSTSYWAAGIPLEIVKKSIEHSLSFGVYKGEQQVGFARVVTDYATFAYIGDVFILEEFRGQGLSKWMMEIIADHPELQGLRRWLLLTSMRRRGLSGRGRLNAIWRSILLMLITPADYSILSSVPQKRSTSSSLL